LLQEHSSDYLLKNFNDQIEMIEKIENLRKTDPASVDRLPKFMAYGETKMGHPYIAMEMLGKNLT